MRLKRLLALLCVCACLLPTAAYAADDTPADSVDFAPAESDAALVAAEMQDPEGALQADTAAPRAADTQPQAVAADPTTVVVSSHKVQVNGKAVSPQAYTIDRYNYFKLRDIASLLSGTSATFDVAWSGEGASQVIDIQTGKAYTTVGGEMTTATVSGIRLKPSTARLTLNGGSVAISGYNINNNNYYKIADLAAAVGFSATFDDATRTVHLTTTDTTPTPTPEPTPEPTPTPAVFVTGVYQVKVETTLSVRSGPGQDHAVIGSLANGNEIIVDSIANGWAHIMDTSTASGRYCSADYITRLRDYDPSAQPVDPVVPPRTSHLDGVMTVIVDPGHGGSDIGAHNADGSLDEKHVNLSVSLYLKQYLENAGVRVIMVRETLEEGSSLSLRGQVIEQYADVADLFFSVHHNAVNTTARGAEVLAQIADRNGGPSKLLAEELMREYSALGLPLRSIVFREGQNGDYYYTNRVAAAAQVPAVTSEFCFIDNVEDQKFIDSEEDLQAEARAQYNAIMRYFEQVAY